MTDNAARVQPRRARREGRVMTNIVKASVACLLSLVLAAAVTLGAQGRGGRAAGAGSGTGTGKGVGTIELITVHSKALEGNLERDAADRDATVYLPPSYAANPERRYPVLYLLHGYGGREDTFTSRLASLQESGDRLSA